VGIPGRGLDVGVIERLLHELQIARTPQKLGAEVVPYVVEAKANDSRLDFKPAPNRFGSTRGERVTPSLDLLTTSSSSDVGEYSIRVMPLEWPEN
jgi:hypothetical protein